MDNSTLRKARGAFFTPVALTEFMCRWAVRQTTDRVLEPSCGDAVFLRAAARRLKALDASDASFTDQLDGVEIHEASAATALAAMRSDGVSAKVWVGDFFDYPSDQKYDAIVGNPPYVRYQNHAGAARSRSIEAALAQGVRLSGLSSSWAAFVVHASSFLKSDGRLALVLPAELLSVNYASEVRRFLLGRFAKLKLIMFETLVFPGVSEEVVILLAEGQGTADCFEVYQAKDVASLPASEDLIWSTHRPAGSAKWTPALLNPSLFASYRAACESSNFSTLGTWGRTYLGAVTGANGYFAISSKQAAALGLKDGELVRISPPGSKHLKGLTYAEAAWKAQCKDGDRTYLFRPKTKPSADALRYINKGEADGVSDAYKCSVREPWWQVPLVQKPDLMLTYMNHDTPRLVTNEANVEILNSVYGVVLNAAHRSLGRSLLPIACLNSVTLLGAEMVGRAYGGGLLKLEPREADLLPIPSVALLTLAGPALETLKPQLAGLLRSGNLAKVVALVDDVLLSTHLRMESAELEALRGGRELLFQRRVSRNRGHGVDRNKRTAGLSVAELGAEAG